MEPALTGGSTSPLPRGTIVSSGSAASSRWSAAPPRSRRRSSPAASARAGHRVSQVVLVPAAWCQAPVSAWPLKSLLSAVAPASASVACTWGDVPGIWTCQAEAAEEFLGTQVVLGPVICSPLSRVVAMSAGRHCRRAGFTGIPVQWSSPTCSPWHQDAHLDGSGRRMAVPRPMSRTVTAGPG
jgi:hypothetical protein